jgi:RNA polymerase sigma-70 factor (ECF subfamily)
MGVPEQDAPDQAQVVFLTAFIKLPGFEGRAALRSWLYGICRFVASNRRRSESRRREVLVDPQALSHHVEGPQASGSARELATHVHSILRRLPPSLSEVLVLFSIGELSANTVAEILGLSHGAVRSRLRSARKHFAIEAMRLERVQLAKGTDSA